MDKEELKTFTGIAFYRDGKCYMTINSEDDYSYIKFACANEILQQELENLKAIEKEHQRINGELIEENQQLKENIKLLDKIIEARNKRIFRLLEELEKTPYTVDN